MGIAIGVTQHRAQSPKHAHDAHSRCTARVAVRRGNLGSGCGACLRLAVTAGTAASGTLEQRIPPPPGFTRIAATPESWATWLRGLPLKPAGAHVLTYTGVPKWRQDVHVAVIESTSAGEICSSARTPSCAFAAFSAGRPVAFNDTDGKRRTFAARDKSDHAAFRKYMDLVFA